MDICLAVAILGMLAVVSARFDLLATRQNTGSVIVNDGDTVTLNGERIRLIGMDAPEYMQACNKGGIDYPCGRQAREALVRLIAGRSVTCEGSKRDRYGRLLAVCNAGGVDLNRAMVEQGWAVAYGDYGDAERMARDRRAGIWAGTFEQPSDWRASHHRNAEPRHDAGNWLFDWLREVLRFW
ncbi:thermonuclease family protein [Pseudaminobacter soli (ex Li et al. 2025)]|uniref:thermonuclease family protein n=1 Tax=Pseudaminobacter soli (ex Li et al. 2025) TaxID=1295366 RepID=UPI001FDFFB64|nr:thermonuclease family protein [Mesorhizobium soli]